MKLDWTKWSLEFWKSVARHVGTAGMTWLGLGVKDGTIEWNNLWVALLVGGILPSVFTFMQRTPSPDEILDQEVKEQDKKNE